jgi:hypothetical protein
MKNLFFYKKVILADLGRTWLILADLGWQRLALAGFLKPYFLLLIKI